jgi:hypothetical protein
MHAAVDQDRSPPQVKRGKAWSLAPRPTVKPAQSQRCDPISNAQIGMIIGFLRWRALGCEKVGRSLPGGCLSDRTFRGAAPLTSLGEFLEVGEAVRHSTSDFYERGPTTSASFLREKTSTDAQVGGRFRFYEQPTIWKARYVRSGLASGNGGFFVHRVPPLRAH